MIDGYTNSEHFRSECEARHCLDSYSLQERREYLQMVEKSRGKTGREKLESAIMKEWEIRKSSKRSA